MDLRERINDDEEMIRSAIDQAMTRMWTSAPGRVVSYNAAKQTASIQVTVKSFVKQPDGTQKAVDLPILEEVPVQFPGAGGQTMTFPVKPGDECVITFMSRAADAQQQSGGDQQPTDASTHSLSHPRAMLGFRSNPRALQNVSTDATEVRSDDGNTKISLSGEAGVGISTDKQVGITAANGVAIGGGAGETTINGTVRIIGELIVNDIVFSTHKHSGVTPGGGNSGVPTN